MVEPRDPASRVPTSPKVTFGPRDRPFATPEFPTIKEGGDVGGDVGVSGRGAFCVSSTSSL